MAVFLAKLPGSWHGAIFPRAVACVYVHPPVSIPIFPIGKKPFVWFGAGFYARAIVYDCWGFAQGRETLGLESIRGTAGEVASKVAWSQQDVAAHAPAFNTFIDLRGASLMMDNCCPHMLLEEEQ